MNWIDYTKQKPTDKDAQYLIYYRWQPDMMLVNEIAQWNGFEFYNLGWDDGIDIRYGDKVKYWMKIEEPMEEQDMELKQAIEICKEMQKWRRGEGIYDGESPAPMPYTPETYGIALDKLIEHAEYKVDPMLAECLKRVDPDVRAEVRKKIEKPTKTCNSDKNLQELTWQDVKRIVEISDDTIGIAYFDRMSEEEYYTEVLRRFKEGSK